MTEGFRGAGVLITGGLGFIGGSLARALVGAGADVTIVDALLPECGGNHANIAGIEDAVTVHEMDLRDAPLAELLEGCDVVFNLAGHTSHIDSMNAPLTDLELNCTAQLTLLEACRRATPAPAVVFAGTRQVYGRPRYLPVDEAHPIDPVDVNGIHKVAAEHYHLLYGQVYGMPVTVLRLTNTYGPGMRVRDARQTFLGVWIRDLVQDREFEVWGDGSQLRDFTYVDDAVAAFLAVAVDPRARGRVLNLGDESSFSLLQLADLCVAANDGGSYRVVPFPADRKPIDIGDYVGDYRAIRELLGWKPTVTLEDGLTRTLEYYRERGGLYW
ncbi:MAG: NAD-dependent epimerase/dehydratase family protein [Gaiellaceae bacterium]